MLGMRFTFHIPVLQQPLIDGKFDWVWSEAEKLGIKLMILVPQHFVHVIDDVAARYPGLKIIMDHMSLTSGKPEDETFRDFDELLPIAKRPNVAVKASALPNYHRRSLSVHESSGLRANAPTRPSVRNACSGAATGRARRCRTANISTCG